MPTGEGIPTAILMAHQGRVRALLLTLRSRLGLQEVVFAAVANLSLLEHPGPAAAPAPLPDYDCCELYQVITRSQRNLLQWLPPLHLTLEDLRLAQARVRGDAGVLTLFLVMRQHVARLRYTHPAAQPGGPGLTAASEAAALCRDARYAAADLRGQTRTSLDPADLLCGPPEDPALAICRALRGLHPAPWILPMGVLAQHYGAFLEKAGVQGPLFARVVQLPPITSAEGQESRRLFSRRQFIEVGLYVRAGSVLYALLLPLVAVGHVLHRLAVAARLAVSWPLLLSPDLLLAVRISPLGFAVHVLSTFWTVCILYVFQLASVPSLSALAALYWKTYTVTYIAKVLVHSTANLLPPAPIVEFIKSADPVGAEGILYHAFFDDFFREESERRAHGGYRRAARAPEVFGLLEEANINLLQPRRPRVHSAVRLALLFLATLLPSFDPQKRF